MEDNNSLPEDISNKRYLETTVFVFLTLIVSITSTYSLYSTNSFILFILLLSLYYLTEYLITLRYSNASISSFLFSYETGHFTFIIFSIIEHVLLVYLQFFLNKNLGKFNQFVQKLNILDFYKSYRSTGFVKVSFTFSLLFLILRIISRISLGSDFTHKIRITKNNTHKLKTTGLYRYLRHPGYTSWYYWNIGMQLLMGNIICLVIAIYYPLKFFKERIKYLI